MQIKVWLKYTVIVLVFLLLGISLYTWDRSLKLENKEFLVEEIKEEKRIQAATYSYKTWNDEYILNVTKNIVDPDEKAQSIDRLRKEETNVVYFHFNKGSIDYFISAQFKEKEEESYCRLAVRNRFFVMDLLNKKDILVGSNHKEHQIDKSICNALYGFGKPVAN